MLKLKVSLGEAATSLSFLYSPTQDRAEGVEIYVISNLLPVNDRHL